LMKSMTLNPNWMNFDLAYLDAMQNRIFPLLPMVTVKG
jgi:hypothetical protein